jgi:hypothetical protein
MPVMSNIARPDALFVAHELQIEALARHADRYSVDAGQPSPQRPRGAGRYEGLGKPGEAECCSQKLAVLVEHVLLHDLVCLEGTYNW